MHVNVFEYQGKMFLSIEKVLEKKSEDQPEMWWPSEEHFFSTFLR